jgi:hypothetical protein
VTHLATTRDFTNLARQKIMNDCCQNIHSPRVWEHNPFATHSSNPLSSAKTTHALLSAAIFEICVRSASTTGISLNKGRNISGRALRATTTPPSREQLWSRTLLQANSLNHRNDVGLTTRCACGARTAAGCASVFRQ